MYNRQDFFQSAKNIEIPSLAAGAVPALAFQMNAAPLVTDRFKVALKIKNMRLMFHHLFPTS